MKLYSVYANHNIQKQHVFVKSGFSFIACIFNILWSLYHKVWEVFLFLISFNAIAIFFQDNQSLSNLFFMWQGLISIGIGICASDIREYYLERYGYVLEDIIYAASEDEALIKFETRRLCGK